MNAKKILSSICLILVITSGITSCGKKADQIDAAISDAHYLLTTRDCAQARAALDKVGYQASNAEYIGAYASTYACEANYSTITFFADDLSKLSSTQGGLMGSLTLFGTSGDMTSATDTDFTKLQSAIDTILYAGGQTSSSSANRKTVFTTEEVSNLNAQALYMTLVNLGRWLHFYGNPDATGVKGAGTNTNNCLFSYTDTNALTALSAGSTGSCTNVSPTGSAAMMAGTATEQKTRLCQGIVMFTNFVDLIANISFGSSQTGSLNNIGTTFDTACATIASKGYDFCSVRDMTGCLAMPLSDLEPFSVLLFEANFL